MNRIKTLGMLRKIMKRTGAHKMLMSYFFFVFLDAFIIYICDPGVPSYRDALWYCYDVISTTGFGDVVVTTFIGRACSVVLTIYSIFVIAIVTAVTVNFYTELIRERNKDREDNS